MRTVSDTSPIFNLAAIDQRTPPRKNSFIRKGHVDFRRRLELSSSDKPIFAVITESASGDKIKIDFGSSCHG